MSQKKGHHIWSIQLKQLISNGFKIIVIMESIANTFNIENNVEEEEENVDDEEYEDQ